MSNRKGFTVIELLTVIAMIGALAAIMQPMLVNSANKSREMLCESNLKHIGVAASIYAEDSGVYPGNLAKVDTVLQDRSMLRCPNCTQDYHYTPLTATTDRQSPLASCIDPKTRAGMPHRSSTCYLELSVAGQVRRVGVH